MNDSPPPRHRWFRYSLRTLFVLVAVVAAPLAWLGVQVKWIHDRQKLVHSVGIDHESEFYMGFGSGCAPWSIRILGADGYKGVYVVVDEPVPHATSSTQRFCMAFSMASPISFCSPCRTGSSR